VKRILSVILIASMLCTGLVFAQESDDPCAQAKHDAMEDTSEILWIGGGCLTGLIFGPIVGLIPVGIGYFLRPLPDEMNLVGKTAEYVDEYTSCYQSRRSMIQGNSAAVGCLGACSVWIAVAIIMLSSLSY